MVQSPQSLVKDKTEDGPCFANWILATARKCSAEQKILDEVVVSGSVHMVSSGSAQSRYRASFSFSDTSLVDGCSVDRMWTYEFPHDHDDGSFDRSEYIAEQLGSLRNILLNFGSSYEIRLQGSGSGTELHVRRAVQD